MPASDSFVKRYVRNLIAPVIAIAADGFAYRNSAWAPRRRPRAPKPVRKARRAQKNARKKNRK